MDFVLFDLSTSAGNAAKYGGPIAPAELLAIAAALELYLNRDVALHWPGAARVTVGKNGGDVQPGEVQARVIDEDTSAPGAVAFHTLGPGGIPSIELERVMCTNISSDGSSVSAALAHELAEAWADPPCNRWADDGGSFSWAFEIADGVEGNWYAISGIAVSDFLLPSFFCLGAPPPYSFMGTQTYANLAAAGVVVSGSYAPPLGPFGTASGGYQARRSVGSGVVDVWGKELMRPARLRHLRKPSSRMARRGARL